MNKEQQREFTYEDGFEDGVQSGKEECIEVLEIMKKHFGNELYSMSGTCAINIAINKIEQEV